VKLQTYNRNASTQKQEEPTQDKITIRYIPLPPEKQPAWERSMRILTQMILEIIEEQAIIERNEHERIQQRRT
jgi:hypothetical protein